MSQSFKASTQYNDLVGSVAADRSDNLAFAEFLKEQKLMAEDEFIVGFEITFNENDSRPVPDPGIVVFLAEGDSVDSIARQKAADGVFKLRSVEVFDLPLADFFAYFKRFNVMFANKSLNLHGEQYDYRD